MLRRINPSFGLLRSFSTHMPSGTSITIPFFTNTKKPLVGAGDRGAGIVYRDGRLRGDMEERDGSDSSQPFIVKIQAPLDNSSDAAGGIGRMIPATLICHDQHLSFLRFVVEGQHGHTSLLQMTIRGDKNTAYAYCQRTSDGIAFFIEDVPDQKQDW